MKGSLNALATLVRRKEWPEQRTLLLVDLSLLLLVWASALLAAMLPSGESGLPRWSGIWAEHGFPLTASFLILPLHGLFAGSGAFRQDRRHGTHEFLHSLPVGAGTTWLAKMLPALGSYLFLVGAAWGLQFLLQNLSAGVSDGPWNILDRPGFYFRIWPLVGAVAVASGAFGTTAFPRRTAGWAGALVMAGVWLGLVPSLLPALSRGAWWPWSLVPLLGAGAVMAGTSSLCLWARRDAGRLGAGIPAAGLLGVLALVATSYLLARETLPLMEPADLAALRVSPEARQVLIPDAEPWRNGHHRRLWYWDLGAGRPPALPAIRILQVVGWRGVSGEALVVGVVPHDIRPGLYAIGSEGPPRRLCSIELPIDPEIDPVRDHLPNADGPDLWLESATGELRDTEGRLVSPLAGSGGEFLGWWRDEVLIATGDNIYRLQPETGSSRELFYGGGIPDHTRPLRMGRYLAFARGARLYLLDDHAREPRLLSDSATWFRWGHPLQTLYFQDAGGIHAWHPEVEDRRLSQEGTAIALLPGSNRILLRTPGGGHEVLHVGTRERTPIQGTAGLAPEVRPLVAPDGHWLAYPLPGGVLLASSRTGGSRRIDLPAPGRIHSWVILSPRPQGAAEPSLAGLLVTAQDGSIRLLAPTGEDRLLWPSRGTNPADPSPRS